MRVEPTTWAWTSSTSSPWGSATVPSGWGGRPSPSSARCAAPLSLPRSLSTGFSSPWTAVYVPVGRFSELHKSNVNPLYSSWNIFFWKGFPIFWYITKNILVMFLNWKKCQKEREIIAFFFNTLFPAFMFVYVVIRHQLVWLQLCNARMENHVIVRLSASPWFRNLPLSASSSVGLARLPLRPVSVTLCSSSTLSRPSWRRTACPWSSLGSTSCPACSASPQTRWPTSACWWPRLWGRASWRKVKMNSWYSRRGLLYLYFQ